MTTERRECKIWLLCNILHRIMFTMNYETSGVSSMSEYVSWSCSRSGWAGDLLGAWRTFDISSFSSVILSSIPIPPLDTKRLHTVDYYCICIRWFMQTFVRSQAIWLQVSYVTWLINNCTVNQTKGDSAKLLSVYLVLTDLKILSRAHSLGNLQQRRVSIEDPTTSKNMSLLRYMYNSHCLIQC